MAGWCFLVRAQSRGIGLRIGGFDGRSMWSRELARSILVHILVYSMHSYQYKTSRGHDIIGMANATLYHLSQLHSVLDVANSS